MSGTVRTAARKAAPRRRWMAPVGAVVVPAVVAVLALIYPGVPVSQVDLNDGSVWLTNTSERKLGRYNAQVEELNAGLVTQALEFDVVQDEGHVLLTENGKASVVDPASVTLAAQVTLPFGTVTSMAAGTVAVNADGDVWARTMATLGTLSTESQDPDLELGPGGVAVVSRSGELLAAEADGTLHRATVTDTEVTSAEDGTLAGDPSGGFQQVTAVGDVLVGLSGRTVHTPSGATDLAEHGAELVLQQPGPRSDVVLVSTPTALLEVPLGGGAVREHESGGSGEPAAPVRVGGCAHAAWATGTGSYLQRCGSADPERLDLEGMTSADRLVFRVNRDVVVLNDTLNGRLWVPTEDPELREPNWQDIEPQEETQEDDEQSESRDSTQNLQAECTAQSSAPSAEDDEYGVRPGRTMILSVIDNDSSSDCGILAVSEFDPLPEDFGVVVPIYGGRSFQLTVAPDASGTAEFTYTIDDGRGTSAPSTATVRLTVRSDAENGAPEQVRVSSVTVEQGGSVTYDTLPDFRDPDGDPLILVWGVAEGGGQVRTRQDGELTFQSDGGTLGRQTVTVQVSDGREVVEGTVHVDVRPAGSVAPTIDPVHAVTYVDQPVVVRPLDSVRSSSREPVRLAGVEELQGATLDSDLEAGTFTFTAPNAGTYYVTFMLAASPQQVQGVARIDVRERPEETPPPVAVLDRALLPPGGEVTIDPLANDVDPAGGVLVVQSVEVPDGTGLRIAVVGHQLLRIDSTRVLDGPVTARYTIHNGTMSATGEVLVLPVPASATQQPPVVPNVSVSVRTGGVVTIPVLQGAYDPDGDRLELVPELAEPLGQGEGLMFVSGDTLRYQAPDRPLEAHATFNVRDAVGNVTAATVTVTVHASDPGSKAPPRPRPLTARVFAAETVRIEVPLTGIDPDGDGVYLLGQDQAPTKGRIVQQGADWLEYEALPGESGTDTFTYAVEDWVGQRAVATVQVGIAPRPTTSADVVSRNDDVTVRPGQRVEVRVLANDVDTGGGELELDPDLVMADDVVAEVEGRRIVVTAPDQPGVVQISYTARNKRGGLGTAVLTVVVDAEASIRPPKARDVVVPATDTINKTEVAVDVMAQAENPSGPMSDLELTVHPSAADVASVVGGEVVVTLGETAQTLPYVVTNINPAADGVHTFAFITVPALGDFPPIPRPGAPELRVVAGEPLRIVLDEHIQVAPGRSPKITTHDSVTATKSDGTPLVVDDRTLTYTAQRDYAGPASISFEVTDGAQGDLDLRTKVMTLPITVLAAEDYPPTFSPSVLEVAPGESTRVDLTAFTSTVGTDAGQRYTYRVTSEPPLGVTANLDGSVLTLSATPAVPKGTVGGLGVEIGYGVDRAVTGQLDFRIVASSRPLARLVDRVVPDGVEGGASTVSVLDGAFNPFPDQPLTVVDAVVETPGAGTAGVSGSQVTVRPAAGFIGQMVTRYRVRDATGDPDREVEGRITVVVRGRPAQPVAPRVVEVRDRTVVLAWDAPANNGEPITGYRLTAQPGGIVTDCASTTCTVGNLTNNQQYVFTVTAQNAVGTSDASPPSPPARPDAKPFAPAAPQTQWGNASLTVTWQAPQNPGSPIVKYDVEISPAPPGGSPTFSTPATSHTFTGLANGTAYTVRVRAVNLAPEPGDWSVASAPQVPAAPPDAPTLRAQRFDQSVFGGGRLEVYWDDPAGNGDAVSQYEIRVNRGTATSPSSRNVHVVDPAGPGTYTFQVRARNKADWGPWSGELVVEHATVPSAPGPLTATFEPDNGAVRLDFADPDWAGGHNGSFQVAVDGGGWSGLPGNRRITGLSAGAHSFVVRACNNEGCGQPTGSASAEVRTRPGDPRPSGIALDSATAPRTFTATWQPPSSTGNLPVRYEYVYRTGRPDPRPSDPDRLDWSGWTSWVDVGEATTSGAVAIPDRILPTGGRIEVAVRARNDMGYGPGNADTMTVDVPAPAPPAGDGGGGGG
ncbi:fibronectin type III domain-containing protein [Actinotalea ferrariae]|uniref:Ig-like domain-containing protein n=1 Tax=Actinotalea ferrariae TaxID=1386098 RepID=UPI001C8C8778|nr:Ig-like domain-containing protein [Actinotalea ferrariae]MBX9244357.1 fibronectin type III domain-containing protein [Actinotalea ferrariae]